MLLCRSIVPIMHHIVLYFTHQKFLPPQNQSRSSYLFLLPEVLLSTFQPVALDVLNLIFYLKPIITATDSINRKAIILFTFILI
jgi:hypothetical protein